MKAMRVSLVTVPVMMRQVNCTEEITKQQCFRQYPNTLSNFSIGTKIPLSPTPVTSTLLESLPIPIKVTKRKNRDVSMNLTKLATFVEFCGISFPQNSTILKNLVRL